MAAARVLPAKQLGVQPWYIAAALPPRDRNGPARRLYRARGRALDRLRALTPPAASPPRVRTMLNYFETSQVLIHRADQLTGKSETILPILLQAAPQDGYARALARQLGLTSCARL